MSTTITDIGTLSLESGATLPNAKLAHVTYGRLDQGGRNAILLTHGYTSSHLFADGGTGASEGSWGGLVGPGRAIDTEKYFVVSSNMLGSAFGSTAPRTPNPRTGRAYGPDFPAITLSDIVGAQRRLLDALGVRELAAVIGPSYGGFQAFAWGALYPDFVRAVVPVVTAPASNSIDVAGLRKRFATDPNWNDGHYYEKGGIAGTMAALRRETLLRYGLEAELAPRIPDKAARDAEIDRIAGAWAEAFDAHSLLVLGDAANRFDAWADLPRLTARVLYVLSRSDALFPPALAPRVMAAMQAGGVDCRYVEIDSDHGHLASGTDFRKWEGALAAFLAG